MVLYLCSFFDKWSVWTRIIKLRRYVVFKVHFMASQFPKLRYSRRKIVFYLIQYKNITREIFYSKNHAENEETLRLLNQRFTQFWFLRKGSENSFLQQKCFSCYILLTDQISLPGCLYFLRYWAICVLYSIGQYGQLFVNQVVTS